MILFDTNIFIEIYRNNQLIIESVKRIGQENIIVSDVVQAELFFGARNKREFLTIKKDMDALQSLSISDDISVMAISLVKKFTLSHKLTLPDALIASTAIIHDLELYALNMRDFVFIKELKIFQNSNSL